MTEQAAFKREAANFSYLVATPDGDVRFGDDTHFMPPNSRYERYKLDFMKKVLEDVVNQTNGKDFGLVVDRLDDRVDVLVQTNKGRFAGNELQLGIERGFLGYTGDVILYIGGEPLPINPEFNSGELVVDGPVKIAYNYMGLHPPESNNVEEIPIASSKGLYSKSSEGKTCSNALKALMISFLKPMRRSREYLGQWLQRRRNTDTSTYSRRR